MRTRFISLVIALTPAALLAQSGSIQSQTQASANSQFHVPSDYSVEGRARLEATLSAAREKGLPEEPIQNRIAEAHAKGAAEAQVISSTQQLSAHMEATQEAMVEAGRPTPSNAEVARGASAMERGVTRAQIEAMAETGPSDRSLVVAFDVLASLVARGVPVDHALAQVESKLEARASDAAITALAVSVNGQGNASGNAAANANGNASASGDAAANANGNAAANVGAGAGSITGSVAGAAGATLGLGKP